MTTEVLGLILAGGLSRRMGGGDKPLVEVEGKTLLARTVERLAPQTGRMLLNANGDPARFAAYGLQVAADVVEGYGGPLVGVLTGLEWMREHMPGCRWMVSVAADTPLFPEDLVPRLLAAVEAEGARLAVAASGPRAHPVFGLWPVDLLDDLRRAVVEEGVRKIDAWTDRYPLARVDWPDRPVDPFFNVNTPEDAIRLGMILAGSFPDEPPLRASRPVAVVVERRDGATAWVTETWRPLEVVDEPPAASPPWAMLRKGEGWEHYLAVAPHLTVHRSDLASYRYNLGGIEPRLYAVLRREDGEGGAPLRVVMVTAAPDEAQKMSESGDDIVDGLTMPPAIRDWVEVFCACHPPDEPMKKRKRDRLDVDRAFTPKEGRP